MWALHALGEPPDDPAVRQEWVDRASRIAAWRELSSYKDPVQPVGPAPKMGAVELRAAWRGAADAAGLSKDDQGIRETPEMQLVAQAREAARVKAWEPADVSEERRDAELAKGDMVAESMMADAAARNAEGPDADKAQELAGSFRQLTQELSVRAAWLGEQDEHRREWHAANAAKVARGVQARAELERRREAGEFIGEWDIAMAYLTLSSDLEPPKHEPGPETTAESEAAAAPEPGAEVEPVAEAEVIASGPRPEAEAEPAPEVIRPVSSDGEWFLDYHAQRKAEAEAATPEPEAAPEAAARSEVDAEAATPEPVAEAEAGAEAEHKPDSAPEVEANVETPVGHALEESDG